MKKENYYPALIINNKEENHKKHRVKIWLIKIFYCKFRFRIILILIKVKDIRKNLKKVQGKNKKLKV